MESNDINLSWFTVKGTYTHNREERPPAESNYDKHGRKRKATNTTFRLLGVPVGSILTANFGGKELRFETMDDKNTIKDLQTGKQMAISAMANTYLGGQNNGFAVFSFDGIKLSDMRAKIDQTYLPSLRTVPKEKSNK